MQINHPRLPENTTRKEFRSWLEFYATREAKQQFDSLPRYVHVGKGSYRSTIGIEIDTENRRFNSRAGFETMREVVAFLRGYKLACKE